MVQESPWRERMEANTSDRLERYVARTQHVLDLMTLLTLWLVLAPVGSFAGDPGEVLRLIGRFAVSLVLAVDLAVRCVLAPHAWRYLLTHPQAALAVVIPPVRLLSSLRLISSLFAQGRLLRFLLAAAALLANGIVIEYLFEKDVPQSSIQSLGDAMWWGVVTVSTVGYGHEYPVTVAGRIVATGVMAMGLVALAVVTAHISARYVDEVHKRRQASHAPTVDATTDDATYVFLHERIDQLEGLLRQVAHDVQTEHPRRGRRDEDLS